MFRREFFASAVGTSILSLFGVKQQTEEKSTFVDMRIGKFEVVSIGGRITHYKNGKIHRDGDKPAVIYADGTQSYYKDGELHRDGDKPAEIFENGRQHFYKNGQLHRDGDKPAVIYADGSQRYFKDGKEGRSKQYG